MSVSLDNVLAVIMGGGRGERLYPLTKLRAKPAVPIAGKYRLIDVPISNCINSGIYQIAVLTQFHSASLNQHIMQAYRLDNFHRVGWLQILAAEQTLYCQDWYHGTADAVRKQLRTIKAAGVSHVLILSGDQLYRMDYAALARYHCETDADITMAVQPVSAHDASRFGILKRSENGRITDFAEKPADPQVQARFANRNNPERPFIGSLGIYMFKIEALVDMLSSFPEHNDFGRDVIPHAIHTRPVYAYDFNGYWRDIGTVRSFYEASLELIGPAAPFNFSNPEQPIYTTPNMLAGSFVQDSVLKNVQLSEGCRIEKADISHTTIGTRSQVGPGTTIKDSVVMGADYYSLPTIKSMDVQVGIGPNCTIEGAILDKNVRIGEGVVIKPFPRGTEMDEEMWAVQDGIVIIPKDAVIPPYTRIAPEVFLVKQDVPQKSIVYTLESSLDSSAVGSTTF